MGYVVPLNSYNSFHENVLVMYIVTLNFALVSKIIKVC